MCLKGQISAGSVVPSSHKGKDCGSTWGRRSVRQDPKPFGNSFWKKIKVPSRLLARKVFTHTFFFFLELAYKKYTQQDKSW